MQISPQLLFAAWMTWFLVSFASDPGINGINIQLKSFYLPHLNSSETHVNSSKLSCWEIHLSICRKAEKLKIPPSYLHPEHNTNARSCLAYWFGTISIAKPCSKPKCEVIIVAWLQCYLIPNTGSKRLLHHITISILWLISQISLVALAIPKSVFFHQSTWGNSCSFYVVAKLFTMQKQQGDIFLFNLRVWGFGIPCLVWPLQTRPRPLAAWLTGEADLICGGWVPEGWSLSHSMWWAGCILLAARWSSQQGRH